MYTKGDEYKDPGDDYVTYGIDSAEHGNVIEVYGDEELRDQILDLLSGSDTVSIAEVRQAVADYISSEGCGCCEAHDLHKKHMDRLGELLQVPKYDDGSGYDFYRFKSGKKEG